MDSRHRVPVEGLDARERFELGAGTKDSACWTNYAMPSCPGTTVAISRSQPIHLIDFKTGAGIELGSPKRLRDFDLGHPAVKKKLEERYGKTIPHDMRVFSPACIFSVDTLVTVPQNP